MENNFYRKGTNNFEEDNLEASVWDDVRGDNSSSNDSHDVTTNNNNSFIEDEIGEDNAINELSQTFANINILGTGIGSPKVEPVLYENTYQASSFTDQSNIFQLPSKQESSHADGEETEDISTNHELLLDKLAPQEDTDFSKFHNSGIDHITDVPKGNADPLFSGEMFASPLPIDTNILNDSNETTKKKDASNTQLNRLFSVKKLRRRPVPASSVETDPLHKAQLDNHSSKQKNEKSNLITQPTISDKNSIIDFDYDNDIDILRKMNSPLYTLSSEKNSINKNDEEIKVAEPMEVQEDSNNNSNIEIIKSDEPSNANNNLLTFKIEVKDPIKVDELAASHIEYSVNTTLVSPQTMSSDSILPSGESQVRRRYRDFRWLYRQLQNNHWGKIIPPPPEKQAVGRFKDDFIENRRFQMESMLNRIARDPVLQRDADFIFFLSSESFNKDSKIREYISGSAAYNDNNDLSEIHISEIKLLGPDDAAIVLKNGGLDTENTRGFMNFSFSSPPKYIEQDQIFIQEYDNLNQLESQLKQIYQSLDLIDSQRNELALTIEEFAKIVKNLAKLEVTRQSTELLSNFSEVQSKIKSILERNSLQDALTLIAMVDEYIRSLASVRATFKQRRKIGYYLGIVENDLKKKLVQFNKQTNNIQQDIKGNEKLLKLKNECDILQARRDKIAKWFGDVTTTIRNELNSYNKTRINEFRSSIEISLEGAIESQKECIELWETFFQTNL
ncbi:sorting nexin 1 PWA37_004234 [Arxiozyma heterogenica]|uniref:sorting nexin 1 n=1 Tax=Arxiozyma heterogenica TaxID=278026 RepID=UPI002EE62ED1